MGGKGNVMWVPVPVNSWTPPWKKSKGGRKGKGKGKKPKQAFADLPEERKMDFIPEKSEIDINKIEVRNDAVLKQMIRDLGVKNLIPGLPKERGNRRGGRQ